MILSLMHLASCENFKTNIASVSIESFVLIVKPIIDIKFRIILLVWKYVLMKNKPQVIAFRTNESICFTVKNISTYI